ncbi:protamine p1 [Colletotrichum truncatum]|uniref:Protamine p1 n=1 Tax=Colletotrichum truncatum TaxID=5467 RepID=A0ACC3Z8S6_COLTU|nr:protamine p1 [Colletotrichum truncatum]KAF6789223.1 protamine p1 [Colletotrichum truncatum]
MTLAKGWRNQPMANMPPYNSTYDDTEVLYAGSDDEHYDNPGERIRRIENAAQRFLDGHIPVLLTSVLKGPFEGPQANGWVNPWRSKRHTISTGLAAAGATINSAIAPTEVSEADSTTSCHLPSPRSLDQVGVTPHPHMNDEDVERVQAWRSATESASQLDDEPTWSLSTDLSQPRSQSYKKRSAADSGWLKRQDNKRRKAEALDDVEGASMLVQPNTQAPRRRQSSSQAGQESRERTVDDSMQSLPSTTNCQRSSRRVSQRASDCSLQHQPPHTPSKATVPPEDGAIAAVLSTPIQTPQSVRKLRATPKTNAHNETSLLQDDVDTSSEEAQDSSDIKVEFETQEDDSFLFRARPKSRGLEAAAAALYEDGQRSTISSDPSETETESEDEAFDLDGDTFMANDTKGTSPESNAEDEGQAEEASDYIAKQRLEGKGLMLQIAADLTHISKPNSLASEFVNVADRQKILQEQHRRGETGVESEETSASQEITIVAQPPSQEEQDEKQTHFASPPTALQNKQTATIISVRQQDEPPSSAAQRVSQQSPWSRPDLTINSPCPAGQAIERQDQSFNTETPIVQRVRNTETPAHKNDSRSTPITILQSSSATSSFNDTVKARHHKMELNTLLNSPLEGLVHIYESPAVPASQQSPWKTDTPILAPEGQSQVNRKPHDESFVDPDCQSPWTMSPEKMRQAAQAALRTKFFNIQRPVSPSPLVSSTPQPSLSTVHVVPEVTPTPAVQTPIPSSSEPVFEIKRFANFMSPSPEKRRRRPLKVGLSAGRLPSTQNLLAATIDNPWDGTSKSARRVTWDPEVKGGEEPDSSDPVTPTVARTASPPPEVAVAELPTGDDDQFQRHYQAVSRRTKIIHRLLPSASQQVLQSPEPMAMAEAFVSADSFKTKAPTAPEAVTAVVDAPLAVSVDSQEAVDDVDDILCNLNEFIQMVDVEADIARTKEEERKVQEKKEQERNKDATSGGRIGGLSLDGFMDAGVWD